MVNLEHHRCNCKLVKMSRRILQLDNVCQRKKHPVSFHKKGSLLLEYDTKKEQVSNIKEEEYKKVN